MAGLLTSPYRGGSLPSAIASDIEASTVVEFGSYSSGSVRDFHPVPFSSPIGDTITWCKITKKYYIKTNVRKIISGLVTPP